MLSIAVATSLILTAPCPQSEHIVLPAPADYRLPQEPSRYRLSPLPAYARQSDIRPLRWEENNNRLQIDAVGVSVRFRF